MELIFFFSSVFSKFVFPLTTRASLLQQKQYCWVTDGMDMDITGPNIHVLPSQNSATGSVFINYYYLRSTLSVILAIRIKKLKIKA